MSLLGNIVRSNKKEPGGAGGIASANNGLSLDTATGTIVQIGNDTGLVTAILLNDREIPMGGFSYLMHSAGNDQLLIDPAGSYKIGDIDNALGKNAFWEINATFPFIGALMFNGLGPTTSVGYTLAQINHNISDGAGNEGSSQQFPTVSTIVYESNSGANGSAVFRAEKIGGNPVARIQVDDGIGVDLINTVIKRDSFTIFDNAAEQFVIDTTNHRYKFGNITAGNNTFLQIDDTTQIITVPGTGDNILEIDKANGLTTFRNGDLSLATGYTKLFTGTNGVGTDGFIDGEMQDNTSAKFIRFSFSSTTQNFEFVGLNGIKISGDTTLLHTGTALSNGAGAFGGTLTNAPAAGNPTKWIKIDDNGTTRHIPAW